MLASTALADAADAQYPATIFAYSLAITAHAVEFARARRSDQYRCSRT